MVSLINVGMPGMGYPEEIAAQDNPSIVPVLQDAQDPSTNPLDVMQVQVIAMETTRVLPPIEGKEAGTMQSVLEENPIPAKEIAPAISEMMDSTVVSSVPMPAIPPMEDPVPVTEIMPVVPSVEDSVPAMEAAEMPPVISVAENPETVSALTTPEAPFLDGGIKGEQASFNPVTLEEPVVKDLSESRPPAVQPPGERRLPPPVPPAANVQILRELETQIQTLRQLETARRTGYDRDRDLYERRRAVTREEVAQALIAWKMTVLERMEMEFSLPQARAIHRTGRAIVPNALGFRPPLGNVQEIQNYLQSHREYLEQRQAIFTEGILRPTMESHEISERAFRTRALTLEQFQTVTRRLELVRTQAELNAILIRIAGANPDQVPGLINDYNRRLIQEYQEEATYRQNRFEVAERRMQIRVVTQSELDRIRQQRDEANRILETARNLTQGANRVPNLILPFGLSDFIRRFLDLR